MGFFLYIYKNKNMAQPVKKKIIEKHPELMLEFFNNQYKNSSKTA